MAYWIGVVAILLGVLLFLILRGMTYREERSRKHTHEEQLMIQQFHERVRKDTKNGTTWQPEE
jgi:hypothetical protein